MGFNSGFKGLTMS